MFYFVLRSQKKTSSVASSTVEVGVFSRSEPWHIELTDDEDQRPHSGPTLSAEDSSDEEEHRTQASTSYTRSTANAPATATRSKSPTTTATGPARALAAVTHASTGTQFDDDDDDDERVVYLTPRQWQPAAVSTDSAHTHSTPASPSKQPSQPTLASPGKRAHDPLLSSFLMSTRSPPNTDGVHSDGVDTVHEEGNTFAPTTDSAEVQPSASADAQLAAYMPSTSITLQLPGDAPPPAQRAAPARQHTSPAATTHASRHHVSLQQQQGRRANTFKGLALPTFATNGSAISARLPRHTRTTRPESHSRYSACVRVRACVRACECIRVCVHVFMYVQVCGCVCVSVCVFGVIILAHFPHWAVNTAHLRLAFSLFVTNVVVLLVMQALTKPLSLTSPYRTCHLPQQGTRQPYHTSQTLPPPPPPLPPPRHQLCLHVCHREQQP